MVVPLTLNKKILKATVSISSKLWMRVVIPLKQCNLDLRIRPVQIINKLNLVFILISTTLNIRENIHRIKYPLDKMVRQIFVHTVSGKTICLNMENLASIRAVKEEVYSREGIPPRYQRLIYSGKLLENDRMLSDYCIGKGCSLFLICF